MTPRCAAAAVVFLMVSSAALTMFHAAWAAPSFSRSENAPSWAVGCRWQWSSDQDVYFCTTVGGSDLRITHVSGTIDDYVAGPCDLNGTRAFLVDGNYSMNIRGTVTVLGFPVPVSWPLTGNTSEYCRIPDLATVRQAGHFTIEMGAMGSATLDSSTDASPPLEAYRFPLDVQDAWRTRSNLTVWQKTTGAFGAYETTSADSTDLNATVPRKEDVQVSAGTFTCYNLTYNGTYTTGNGAPQPANSSALYSPIVTNLVMRTFEPLAGMPVHFGLSSYSLNHAPVVSFPLPAVAFPEDSTGSLDLSTVFSDPDPKDALRFSASNFTNITVTVDNSSALATFSPPKFWRGSENISFMATDTMGASAAAEIAVTVTPVNHAPALVRPLPGIIMDEDTVNGSLDLHDSFGDTDQMYGDSLNFSFRDNGSIAVSISPGGIVTLRPFENWSGLHNITFIATDTQGAWASGTLKVAVLNTPDAPVVVTGVHEFTIPEDTTLAVDLSERFYDADIPYGDSLLFAVADVPKGFSIKLDERTGKLELTPPRDFNGRIDIGLIATDTTGLSATERVSITVTPVNDPPAIIASYPAGGEWTMPENSSADFSVAATDVDSPRLTFSWSLDGQLAGAGANFTYSAGFDSAGGHRLTAVVSDGEFNTSRSWNVTVTNVDRPPVNVTIVSPADGTRFRPEEKVSLSADANDPDGDVLSFTWKDTDGKYLGTGKDLELRNLTRGRHNISLEVSDGNATVGTTVSLWVSSPPGTKAPGFTGAAALLAAAVAIFLATLLRRR